MLEVAIRSPDVGGRCTRSTGSKGEGDASTQLQREDLTEANGGKGSTHGLGWERTDDVLTLQELRGYFAAEKVGKPAKNGGDLTL